MLVLLCKCELCYFATVLFAVLGLGRTPSWAVLFGPARHERACLVPCSNGVGSPSDGPVRPGYQIGLKRAGSNVLGLGRAVPSVWTSIHCSVGRLAIAPHALAWWHKPVGLGHHIHLLRVVATSLRNLGPSPSSPIHMSSHLGRI